MDAISIILHQSWGFVGKLCPCVVIFRKYLRSMQLPSNFGAGFFLILSYFNRFYTLSPPQVITALVPTFNSFSGLIFDNQSAKSSSTASIFFSFFSSIGARFMIGFTNLLNSPIFLC